jgi:hypothetical protein
MVGVCFKYDGANTSLIRDEYYELMKAFPNVVIFERCVPIEAELDYNGRVFNSIENIDDLPLDHDVVILSSQTASEIQGTLNLKDFTHPENVIYYIGDDHSHITQESLGDRTDYDVVYIPIDDNMWSPQALSILLYDITVKNG